LPKLNLNQLTGQSPVVLQIRFLVMSDHERGDKPARRFFQIGGGGILKSGAA